MSIFKLKTAQAASFLQGVLIFVLLLTGAATVSAAEKVTNPNDFTKEAGWTCDKANHFASKLSCTNTDTSTATCTTKQEGAGLYSPGTTLWECKVTNPDKTTYEIKTSASVAEVTVEKVEKDANGSTTAFNYNSEPVGGGSECSMSNPMQCLINLPGMLLTAIAFFILMFSSILLYLAGTVFNWVVIRTVFQFGTYFGTSDSMLLAWGVMRDIANIGLLFGFIFMGILLILNVDGGGHGHGHGGGISAKRAIPRLIIFAILLNFSLFATQFVIDIANGFSSTFVTLAGEECSTETSSGQSASGGQAIEECANNGVSGKIIAAAGVTKIFQVETLGQMWSNIVGRPYSYAVSLIMLSILVVVTAIVLLAGAIMLVIRVVILSLLMVTSPIGFAGMAIPKLEGIAKQWWDKLISQAFFAPVYLLLIFISVKLTEGLMQGQASLATAIIASEGNTVAGNMQVVMVFFIVIGFMAASLILASKMGAMGASFAATFAQRAVTTPFAMAGRATIGAGSARALSAYEGAMGRARAGTGILGTLARSPIGNLVDDAVAPTLTQGKNMKFFGGRSYEENRKHREERSSHLAHEADKAQASAELKEALKTLNGIEDTPANAAAREAAQSAVQASLQKMGTGDVRDLLKGSKADLDTIARNLSPEKFAELMKDKELSADKKHALSHGRFGSLAGADWTKRDEVRKWSNEDLIEYAKSDPNAFAQLINQRGPNGESVISDEQREALEKAKGLTNSQRQLVKNNSVTKRLDAAIKSGDLTAAREMIKNIKKPKDKAKLDGATLAHDEVIKTLTASDLKEIMAEGKLDDTQRDQIRAAIWNTAHPNHQKIKDYLENGRTDQLVKDYWSQP